MIMLMLRHWNYYLEKNTGVEVILFTENGHGRKGFLTDSVVNDFNGQYPPLRIKSQFAKR